MTNPAPKVASSRLLALLAGGIALAFTIARTVPALLRSERYESDAAMHVWWMYRYVDPALFPNDRYYQLYASDAVAPLGYRFLYHGLSLVMDPLFASKLVAGLLMLFSAWLAYLVGRRSSPERSRLGGLVGLLVLFALQSKFQLLVPCAIERGFATPIMLLGVWGLLARRADVVGLSVLLATLFYPISLLVLGLTIVVVEGVRLIQSRKMPKGWVPGLIFVAASFALLAARRVPPEIGPRISYDQARNIPELWHYGETYFSNDFVQFWFLGDSSGFWITPIWTAIWAVLLLSIVIWRGWKAIPLVGWVLLATSVGSFLMGHLLAFSLFVPNRHTRTTLPLFAVMALAALVPMLVDRLVKFPFVARVIEFIARPKVAWTLTLLALGANLASAAALARVRYTYFPESPDIRDAYRYIQTQTPKDTIIASDPFNSADIPLRTRRSVVVAALFSFPYYRDYYPPTRARIEAEWAATYADDWKTLDQLNKDYGAKIFLLHSKVLDHFEGAPSDYPKSSPPPGDDRLVLKHLPADRILFHEGDVYLIRLGPGH